MPFSLAISYAKIMFISEIFHTMLVFLYLPILNLYLITGSEVTAASISLLVSFFTLTLVKTIYTIKYYIQTL